MKVSNQNAAMQAIQSFVAQSTGAAKQTAAIGQQIAGKVSGLALQVVGQAPQQIISKPPMLKYGIFPPKPPITPDDPPLVLRYGIRPPIEPPPDPPMVLRYGIIPPPNRDDQ